MLVFSGSSVEGVLSGISGKASCLGFDELFFVSKEGAEGWIAKFSLATTRGRSEASSPRGEARIRRSEDLFVIGIVKGPGQSHASAIPSLSRIAVILFCVS